MGLSTLERATIEKAISVGTGGMAVPLSLGHCTYLARLVATDLDLARSLDIDPVSQPYFSPVDPRALKDETLDPWILLEALAQYSRDVVTYFCCLASLHKTRMKFARILQSQGLPNFDQIGPRSLLQFGTMSPRALAAFLVWRKWLYDIDNRSAQETGYLFEPILAHAIGGTPVSSKKSPIRRRDDPKKGRQVDCVARNLAYEFKLRVTIAASGQGRWREELDFPRDCSASGYVPVLVVFDPTPNPKLAELEEAFLVEGGHCFIGPPAWQHLEQAAGTTMSRFIENYVRAPMSEMLQEFQNDSPSDILFSMRDGAFHVAVGKDSYTYARGDIQAEGDAEPLPDDVEDEAPGIS